MFYNLKFTPCGLVRGIIIQGEVNAVKSMCLIPPIELDNVKSYGNFSNRLSLRLLTDLLSVNRRNYNMMLSVFCCCNSISQEIVVLSILANSYP